MTSQTTRITTGSSSTLDSDSVWRQRYAHLQELVQYRYLLKNLVLRELKVRYKNSVLGILWSLLNPLLMMMVYTILFTVLIRDNPIRSYPIFILVALIPWNFLSGSLLGGTVAVTSNASLIKKVYFPRILLPTAVVLSNLVNFMLACIVLVVLLFVFGIGLTVHALWLPVILLIQVIFMLGLSLILCTLHAFYRDVRMVLDVAILAWFFLTPIFYPFEQLAAEATLIGIPFDAAVVMRWLNPMASIVDGYRTVLWGTIGSHGPTSMDPAYLLRTFVTAVLVFVIGYAVFARSEHLFGEKL